jgi:glycosyltransferase involved in cell wall biosynthesis
MVEDGVTGFVVPPNDPVALGGAIARLFALSEDELRGLGEAARRRALATFTRDRYFREMSAIYDQLLGRSRAADAAA